LDQILIHLLVGLVYFLTEVVLVLDLVLELFILHAGKIVAFAWLLDFVHVVFVHALWLVVVLLLVLVVLLEWWQVPHVHLLLT
jgi:hypothetical protein